MIHELEKINLYSEPGRYTSTLFLGIRKLEIVHCRKRLCQNCVSTINVLVNSGNAIVFGPFPLIYLCGLTLAAV